MSAVVNVQQDRTRRLGASEVAVALGISPWEPPLSLWLRLTGRQAPKVSTEPMEWGNKLEGVIRGEYVERHKVNVFVPKESVIHPVLSYLGATPDGIVLDGDDAGREFWKHDLQIKAPGAYQLGRWGTPDEPEVPSEIVVQVAIEMACCDLPYADVVALIGGNVYVERRVERDADLEADLLAGIEEFWKLVETDTPPAVDGSDAYSEYLKKRLEKKTGTLEATEPMEALIGRWREVEQALKGNETERELVRNLVMAEMDKHSASSVMSKHGRIYMQAGRVDYDDKALAQELCNRLQLRGEAIDFAAERERFKKTGNPFPKRPNAWTAKGK